MTAVIVRLPVADRPPPAPQRTDTRLGAFLRTVIARAIRRPPSRPPRRRHRTPRGPVLFSEYGWG